MFRNLKKYGKDYKKIAKVFKNKEVNEVRSKVQALWYRIKMNPKGHKYAKHIKELTAPIPGSPCWTKEMNTRFVKALEQHGKDFTKLQEIFPEIRYKRLYARALVLKRAIQRNSNHPSKHLKATLEHKEEPVWS